MDNWFRKHLNWSYVFVHIAYFILDKVMHKVVEVYFYLTEPFVTQGVIQGAYETWTGLLWLVIFIPVSIKILQEKNRSMWWMSLFWIFSPLWLTTTRKD